ATRAGVRARRATGARAAARARRAAATRADVRGRRSARLRAVLRRPRLLVQRVAEMPWFPGVAPDEVEALGVAFQPWVGGRWAEVALRGGAVEWGVGAGDPLRVRVPRPQRRLLGVRSVRARDRERDAVRARRRLHAIERKRDVGAHRLALSV